jgi:hypothetical protein
MNRLCSFLLALLLLSPVIDIPEPAADWHGIAYFQERFRQWDSGALVVDVEVRDGPNGHMCWMTFWRSGRGLMEIVVPMEEK